MLPPAPCGPSRLMTCTRRSPSKYGGGRNMTPSTTVNTVVVAPMPSPSVDNAVTVNHGLRRNSRSVNRRSCTNRSNHPPAHISFEPPSRGSLLPYRLTVDTGISAMRTITAEACLTRVEPVDPVERREFDGLDIPPGAESLNHFRLKQPDDRFREGIVVRI